MEEQNKNNLNFGLAEPGKSRKKYWKFVAGFLVIIILTGAIYFVWDKYFSPAEKYQREVEKNYQKYLDWQRNYEKAMREDTYGGKTPEETLKMFIEALKKEDVEMASKYFMLETNTQDPNYLTRRKWEEALKKVKDEGKLKEIVSIISKSVPDLEARISEDYYVYTTRDENGTVAADIDLYFNKYSGIWKIQGL